MASESALQKQVAELKEQLTRETRRANNAVEELRLAREQNLAVVGCLFLTPQIPHGCRGYRVLHCLMHRVCQQHKQVEQEEEYITNKLMKRLEQLKKEKQLLATEVEQEEEFLTNTLHKKLEKVVKEKEQMENQLEAEQEYIVNKLQKQLEDLNREKATLNQEKVRLEMQLEAEQEYIVNKLQKQVENLAHEKSQMKEERSKLSCQIDDLTSSVMKLSTEKVKLEQELESEEELIVNRMQRQFDTLMENYNRLERIMKAHNLQVPESELLPMPFAPAMEPRQFQFVRWSPPLMHSVGHPRPSDTLHGWRSRSLSASPHRNRGSRSRRSLDQDRAPDTREALRGRTMPQLLDRHNLPSEEDR